MKCNYQLVYVSDFKYSIVLSPYISEFQFGKCGNYYCVWQSEDYRQVTLWVSTLSVCYRAKWLWKNSLEITLIDCIFLCPFNKWIKNIYWLIGVVIDWGWALKWFRPDVIIITERKKYIIASSSPQIKLDNGWISNQR